MNAIKVNTIREYNDYRYKRNLRIFWFLWTAAITCATIATLVIASIILN